MLEFVTKYTVRKFLRLVDGPKKLRNVGEPFFWLAGFRKRANQPQVPAKVAVIKLDRLGDLVLGSHQLADLRRAWPDARITLFVRESLVDLARRCPDVDEVIGLPVYEDGLSFEPEPGKYRGWQEQVAKWLGCCHHKKLWKKNFDTALVLRWETDHYGAVLLAYLLGARRRWGVTEMATATKAVANRGFDQLLTQVVSGQCDRHEFLLGQSFLEALGIRQFDGSTLVSWATEPDRKQAADILAAAGVVAAKKTILVCMGAGSQARMWPVECYAKLFEAVFALEKVQFVTLGVPAENGLGIRLKKQLGNSVINLEGRLPLNLLPAAVSLGALYVGSDTGNMHLAVAAGLAVFEFSGHPLAGEPHWCESPVRFGPWAVANRIIQPEKAALPCEKYCSSREPHCILGISHEQSVAALRSLLKQIGCPDVCRDEQGLEQPVQFSKTSI